MKKWIALFLALVVLAGMSVACASAEAPDDSAWILPETIEMTEKVTDVFNEAMKNLLGVHYEPLGYLGEKDGTYCILCRATVVVPDAKPYYALVYVNAAGVQNIWDIWMDKHASP